MNSSPSVNPFNQQTSRSILRAQSYTLIVLAVTATVLLFSPTISSLIAIWTSSDTYAHGFVVLPISAWLLYRLRNELAAIVPTSSPWLLLPFFLCCLLWLVAGVGGVQVVQQFALIATIPLLVWMLAGRVVLTAALFPIMFLFFMVPVGQNLTQHLMEWTADFVVVALRLTGFTVYHDGVFITLPVGKFHVAEACSGIRYLIASVTIGTLYAYLIYRSYQRRLLFILASIIVPILANGVRAYLIIIVAHHTNLEYAVGFDHLIAGAIFFGVIIFVLFWLGRIWQEDPNQREGGERSRVLLDAVDSSTASSANLREIILLSISVLLIAGLFQFFSSFINMKLSSVDSSPEWELSEAFGEWNRVEYELTDWRHGYQGMDEQYGAVYFDGEHHIGVILLWYSGKDNNGELISAANTVLGDDDQRWREVSINQRGVSGIKRLSEVTEHILRSRGQDIQVWRWYMIGGINTSNPYLGKLVEVYAKLRGAIGSTGVILYTESSGNGSDTHTTLNRFAQEALPAIEAGLGESQGLFKD